ncbi:putative bifunctional diguanylate cyclase/phosphodiesterase [Lutispora thermophila]|uniref:putative bifunctional diguanylate cyclase/phosphodiesterase n=1 Tax=Lutispora thermophila TaxID=288966 RepID=UPI0015878DD0|nr:EAL domain-containing protein [Lutispora thermophila]
MKIDLVAAMEKEELFLCYQPIINTMTKRIAGVEALIRWKHPNQGIISPLQFIPVAEETRLIIPIGLWVLRTASSKLKEWHENGFADISLSVNVSAIQLQQPDFGEAVIKILYETGMFPEYLELEITESLLLESSLIAANNLSYLNKQGVRITIDDFGTGYNSLKYIQELDVSSFKIDRTFIYNIGDKVNKAIIDAIIKLGHDINIEIIGEGVETKEQYDYLKKKRCHKVQGYYFSKPLLPEEMGEFLKEYIKRKGY